MRIGIDGRILRDDFPGIGRFTHNLIRALQPQLDGDTLVVLHDPTTRSRYDTQRLGDLPGIELTPCDVPLRSLSQQRKLPALLRTLRLDVFHAPYYLTAYWRLPCPMVLTLYDVIPLLYPASLPSIVDRLIYRLAVGQAVRAAARIIVCSQTAQQDVARTLKQPAERMTVVPGAPDPIFAPEGDPRVVRRVRELYSVPPRYFLHVGTNKPHKNLETLLEAYQRYHNTTPAETRASLVLVGEEDPRYVSSRRWAAQWGLARSVLSLGNVPDEDLRALYNGALAVAFPSLYEGFGLPLVEAMACGAPVLASNTSALPEIAADAALLLEPRDAAAWATALRQVADDESLRADLKARGLARASQFSWPTSAGATLAVYRASAD
ncbi:MAG: glycosyltransferase family 4 protein [Anaerolineae bacterium]